MGSNRKIEVTAETRKKIRKIFNVSISTVNNALSYNGGSRSMSETARRIRIYALKNGGIPCVTYPECETIHDAMGIMRQTFNNGCRIEVDKHSGDAKWFTPDGKMGGEVKDISIQGLYIMQEQAAGF